jgi:hypothetical protein
MISEEIAFFLYLNIATCNMKSIKFYVHFKSNHPGGNLAIVASGLSLLTFIKHNQHC